MSIYVCLHHTYIYIFIKCVLVPTSINYVINKCTYTFVAPMWEFCIYLKKVDP